MEFNLNKNKIITVSEHLQRAVESMGKAKLKEQQRTEYRRILTSSLNKIADKTDRQGGQEASNLIIQNNDQVRVL